MSNNSTLLASFSHEASNNWMLLFVATLFAGTILFFVGLYIGRRFWRRFEDLSDQIHLDNKKRSEMLSRQQSSFTKIQESFEPTR